MNRFNPLAGKTQAVASVPAPSPSALKPRAKRAADALSNAPAATPDAPATPATPTAWQPESELAKAAMRVPLAMYVALTPGLTTEQADGHRLGFGMFCDTHRTSFTDWRKAHLAYRMPKAPIDQAAYDRLIAPYPAPETPAPAADPAPAVTEAPSNVIPFAPPTPAPDAMDLRIQKFLATLRR